MRFTKNQGEPLFTDQELLTTYLFGVGFERRFQVKDNYTANHWLSWLPQLPSYAAYNARLNRLASVFPVLVEHLLAKYKEGQSQQDKQRHKAADDLYSKAVSKVRQSIESFFNWLIEHTDIQRAAKVRSLKGLIVHIFGKIAAALIPKFIKRALVSP